MGVKVGYNFGLFKGKRDDFVATRGPREPKLPILFQWVKTYSKFVPPAALLSASVHVVPNPVSNIVEDLLRASSWVERNRILRFALTS